MDLAAQLKAGIEQQGLSLSERQLQQLLDFIGQIRRWNRTHNLTAITDPAQMVSKHLLDSLSLLPYIDSDELLDVGSGAGLPAIPLAIARPGLHCTAIDASYKRVVFIRQAAAALGLTNLEAVHARVEDYSDRRFQRICSRAFSSLADFVQSSAHLLAEGGQWLAMKGVDPEHEKAGLPAGVEISAEYVLEVPGLAAQRRLVILRPVKNA